MVLRRRVSVFFFNHVCVSVDLFAYINQDFRLIFIFLKFNPLTFGQDLAQRVLRHTMSLKAILIMICIPKMAAALLSQDRLPLVRSGDFCLMAV